jgi:hypothetical protein
MSVFISYARADSGFVDLLYRLLASKGYSVWMDRQSIKAGSQWDMAIQQAVDTCGYVVVVLTPDSVSSSNVADEWNYALDRKKSVIPLLYQSCDIPMRLHRVQWIDFTNQAFDRSFKELTQLLGEPDNRPTDPIELAKREGLVFVDTLAAFGIGGLRIAFDYREYPQMGPFLNAVWQTLLSRAVEPHQYGLSWFLKDKTTGRNYLPEDTWDKDNLLHEVGIEPGAQLTVILVKETDRL